MKKVQLIEEISRISRLNEVLHISVTNFSAVLKDKNDELDQQDRLIDKLEKDIRFYKLMDLLWLVFFIAVLFYIILSNV